MAIFEEIGAMMTRGNAAKVQELITGALEEGITAKELLNKGLLDTMGVIGEKFKKNEVFVPEVLIAARAMNAGLKILEPVLIEEAVEPVGKFIMGTVKGDLHDIGKNLVVMMVKGAGFEVIDLGVDVTPEQFADKAVETGADIVGMSALLTTTMGNMKAVIEEFEKRGIKDQFKFMVGGAPVTDNFAKEIGADYYTEDAASAAQVAKQIVLN